MRVLYLIVRYPNFSETYMHEEMRSIGRDHEFRVVTYKQSDRPRRDPFPYTVIPYDDTCPVYGAIGKVNRQFDSPGQQRFFDDVAAVIDDFRPDVVHGHYLGLVLILDELARRHGIPYTVRTHSQDVLFEPAEKLETLCRLTREPQCLRVLAFPAFRQRLLDAGADEDTVVACWPAINYGRFYRPDAPATDAVMCDGPALPKKAHDQFIDLAAAMRDTDRRFDLYGRGSWLEKTIAHNEAMGSPATVTYADPDDMPDVYARHGWLVYPSVTHESKVGLPVSLAEAQASGLGVCWQELPGRREEQLDYLGGAGFLFQSIDEAPAIISRPYPEEMRQRGLANARKCDIESHRHLLIDAWATAAHPLPT